MTSWAGTFVQSGSNVTNKPVRWTSTIAQGGWVDVGTLGTRTTRVPDPADRRAKLVLATGRGDDVVRIAHKLVPEVEHWVTTALDTERAGALRRDLETLSDALQRGAVLSGEPR